MKKKTKNLIIVIASVMVIISMFVLFFSGFILGPDRKWVSPLKLNKSQSDSSNK